MLETEIVTDRVWRIGLPLDVASIASSNCYVLVDDAGDAHVIDSGLDSARHWELFAQGLQLIGVDITSVRTVVGTHLHRDHIGMAARIRVASGAAVVVHEIEARHLRLTPPTRADLRAGLERQGVPVDQLDTYLTDEIGDGIARGVPVTAAVEDGDVLEFPGLRLEIIHTPGHTAGHICIRVAERRVLLTGDHLLPVINPGLGLGGPHEGDVLAEYVRGLERVARFSDHLVLPGHGRPFRGAAERCDRIRVHHARRTREIAEVIAESAAFTVWEVANRISWRSLWRDLTPVLQNSALRQTEIHLNHLARRPPVRA